MKRFRILLWVAVCVRGAASLLSAANARDAERSLHVRFSEPIIEIPMGVESGGEEFIEMKQHQLGQLLLRSNIVGIRYAFPPELRVDSVEYNRYGLPVKRPNLDGIFRLTFDSRGSRDACARSLEAREGVLLVERCGPVRAEAVYPTDTGFYRQWGLHNTGDDVGEVEDADIDAPEAWELETGSSNTIIAIIDLGVRADHEDLTPRVYGDPQYHYHGTHVGGIAAASANNVGGGCGVNWNAMLLNKVYDSTDHETVPPLIVSSVDMGADVINNSWSVDDNYFAIASAAAFAVKMDRVFVAAKGNDDSDNPLYPADYPFAFSVAASNHRDHRCDFSNYGNGVDVAAPGWGIFSTFASTPYAYGWDQGTSMAAPFVSGIASLLQTHRSDLCNDDILNLIRYSTDDIDELPASPGYDDYTGWGRVNARQALDLLHPPYSLDHYTTIGGWVHHTDGPPLTWTFFDNPYIYDGVYYVARHEVRKDVTFDKEYVDVPLAWGRGPATQGGSPYNPNYGLGFTGVVDGSVTADGCQLVSFVYEVWTVYGDYLGWVPCQPSQVQFAYTVVGSADPDGDAVLNPHDICPYTYNPEQDSAALKEWSETFEIADGFRDARSVLPMVDGSYLVAGQPPEPDPFCDFQVWETDACGSIAWGPTCVSNPFRSAADGSPTEVASAADHRDFAFTHPRMSPTADGGFIALTSEGLALVKLNQYGNQEWYRSLPSLLWGFSVREIPSGGYVAILQGNDLNMYLQWFDAAGTPTYYYSLGQPPHFYPDAGDVLPTSDGGTICVVDWDVGGGTGVDIRAVKLNSSRVLEWDETFGGSNIDIPTTLFEKEGEGYIIAGNVEYYSGDYDQRIMKINSTGTQVIWDRIHGGSDAEFTLCATVAPYGGYLLAGSTDGHGANGVDFYLFKVDRDGRKQTAELYHGLENEAANSCIATDDGGFIVGGACWSADDGSPLGGLVVKVPPCCVGIRGNVNGDAGEVIDISDLVYLIDYMFTSGPPPPCMEEADINGDGEEIIDNSDLVYLNDYMFTSGPEPPGCP